MPPARHPPRRRRRSLVNPWSLGAAIVVVAAAVTLALTVDDTPEPGSAAPALIRTGERNEMGMPVVATPGGATGRAVAGPIEVTGANWSLGQVPLNTAVRPTWVLRNTGGDSVTVGEPHAEVRQGCCPGPFTIGTRTIPPGGTTTMSFELSMHPGMDGWHDIAVHVPVGPSETLTLGVTGDFRDA